MKQQLSILAGIIGLALPALTNTSSVVPAGTSVIVRTNATIDSSITGPGQLFSAVVEENITDQNGHLVVPKGSSALVGIKEVSKKQVTLDLASITIGNRRHPVVSDTQT